MPNALETTFILLQSKDSDQRYTAFLDLLKLAEKPVSWAYAIWDDLLSLTIHGDNHQRTIAVQLLAQLAKSDPEQRMLHDFPQLWQVTFDEKFVTARHSLQCLWKIALVDSETYDMVTSAFSVRFFQASSEKNYTLIRYDILEVLRKIYNIQPSENLQRMAEALIKSEDDLKYRKKYAGLWKDVFKIV